MYKLLHVLFKAKRAERHPLEMLCIGFVYASLSVLLSLWIFPEYASLVMVFLTVMSCLYVVQNALILEEKKERLVGSERTLLKTHMRTLLFLMFLFMGFFLGFMVWAIVLPTDVAAVSFSLQEASANRIQAITGNSVTSDSFMRILANNFKVLAFSLIFALFYGAGAVFILAWNASVMGFVIGQLAKNTFGFIGLTLLFGKYFLHGIPEMLSYFTAALAGGIVFVSVVRGDLYTGWKRTLLDVTLVLAISLIFLVLAALLEVYVSPYI